MKTAAILAAATLLAACDNSKPPAQPAPPPRIESVADIPVPVNVSPPVETAAYEDGYKLGIEAGEAAGKARMNPRPKTKPKPPADGELAVFALDAAGTDTKRGPKWQRGFIAGFRDAFVGEVEGKR